MEIEGPKAKEYTRQEILSLAARLRDGSVKLLDVLAAAHQRYALVTGEPQEESDPATVEALRELADAAAEVWRRDGERMVQDTFFEIGRGVATGKFGGDFFRGIK